VLASNCTLKQFCFNLFNSQLGMG